MSLLQLEHVSKCYGRVSERVALRDVSLRMEPGEMVVVWGMRRSGRSTLLRIASGVETPDAGVVRFEGRDLYARHGERLGDGIGYCRRTFASSEGQLVLDHLIIGLLARGLALPQAAGRARAALERVGIGYCAALRPAQLDCAEAVRAAIARALTFAPKLLLIDEPTIGVDLLARDGILTLLRSLAQEGIAILASTGESPSLSGGRALMLSEGELHGGRPRELATVVPLRRSA
ncbi:MAG TPA: ATP-binding cassette domain-containing protein [Solirubrobacteraceae bacterium]|jgi:ABC-type multidrug transport system ATPase subunit|nr:ATP-binding cassette domain-containing protein [Solirubrobacteraceae bacterium]